MRKDNIKIQIETVLNLLPTEIIPGHKIEINSTIVPSDIDNLYLYREKGTTCVGCGMKATHFYIEKFGNGKMVYNSWHLNLYGISENGKETLFTKDHIVPKINGGSDEMINLTPMCSKCNCRKGDKSMSDFLKNVTQAKEYKQRTSKKRSNLMVQMKYKERVICRMEERYGLKIEPLDYKEMLKKASGPALILCDLSNNKTIRVINYKNKNINVVYNSEYAILETVIDSDYEKIKFEYLPAYMPREFAEKNFEEVLKQAEQDFQMKESDKETALYFQTKENKELLFSMWKKKQHMNRIIWRIVREKFNKQYKKQENVT